MPNLVELPDFLKATRETKITDPGELLNEATLNNYNTIGKMLLGASKDAVTKAGGSKLVEKVQTRDTASFQFTHPFDQVDVTRVPTLQTIEVPWAFVLTDYTFDEREITLNKNDSEIRAAFVDLRKSLKQSEVVDFCNGMESALWATPAAATMEGSINGGSQHAMSIFSYVTRDGLAPSSTNGGVTGSDWTTVASVNPTAETWWRNQTKTYTAASPSDGDTGIVAAMDYMIRKVQFTVPTQMKQYQKDTMLQKQMIATNLDGELLFKKVCRELNDRLDQVRDPSLPTVSFRGLPIEYIAQLDNAGWTSGQPDFLFLNTSYLFPVFNKALYMKEQIRQPDKQPHVTVVYNSSAYNLFCRSRRRQGRIYAV